MTETTLDIDVPTKRDLELGKLKLICNRPTKVTPCEFPLCKNIVSQHAAHRQWQLVQTNMAGYGLILMACEQSIKKFSHVVI
jgi:hypothetical protein